MNRSIFFATALYLLFVIYGSLVPLDFNNLPFETALSQFNNIPYLDLGPDSRADWIANILLYIPLAFGASAMFGVVHPPFMRLVLSICVLVFCITIAVAVEFTQQFFPPRTVSINDLIAETLGTVIGILGWQLFGTYFSDLYRHLLRGSLLSVKAAIIFYLLIYVSLSLFPFDFVTSLEELDTKLANGNDAVVLPFDACSTEPVRCGVKLLTEILVLLPLGFLFCYLPFVTHVRTLTLLVGFFLGLFIEVLQVFLISGSGQGLSVLTRMLGLFAGASLYAWAKQQSLSNISKLMRKIVRIAVLPYLILVFLLNGWFVDDWLSSEQAFLKLKETRFLPFYYFYYTTESVALVSLLSNLGMYLPVGLLYWANYFNPDNEQDRKPPPHWVYVGLIAAFFALVVESGKLFLPDKHADPSDIWIAFISAAGTYVFMNHFLEWLNRDKTPAKPAMGEQIPQSSLVHAPKNTVESVLADFEIDKKWRVFSFLLWAIIAISLLDYPLAAIWLAVFLVGYTVLLFYFPFAWLIGIPALLPIMDFAPWTGRFFFDEFDLVILATLASYYWRLPAQHMRSLLSTPTLLVMFVFSLLYGVSLVRGLLPLPELNANAFNNYYSHFNSLRVGKGFIWSLLLFPLLQLTIRRYRFAPDYFAYGVLLGLSGVTVFAVIERLTFTSLLDFATDYRINALFSSMHAGGGHIESYLMLSLPFITLLFVNSAHNLPRILLGIALFVAGLYTLLVTFSRGGYIGFGIGFFVLVAALLVCFRKVLFATRRPLLILPLLAISLLMALPVMRGSMIQHRLSVVDEDRDSRTFHWHDALNMRANDIPTKLFGMGLGSYPRTFFWLNSEDTHPGTYEIGNENGNTYLRLRGGDALFMGQYLTIEPHTPYRLVMNIRSETANLALSISLCEKSVQYSLRCSSVMATASKGDWEHVELDINSNEVGERVTSWLKRPVQIAFYNGDGKSKLVDIDNVQLLDNTDTNLLANGDFTDGTDFWYFAAEKHNPWHIFNFWVHLLFDLGWLGLTAFFLLFAKAIYNCCRQLTKQNVFAAILLSSFSGFMTVGFVDSPFDAPRLTLLFFLMLFFALLRTPRAWLKQ